MRRFHGVAIRYVESYLGWRRIIIERATDFLSPQSILFATLGFKNVQQFMMT